MPEQGPVERIDGTSSEPKGSRKSWDYHFEGRPSWLTGQILRIGCQVGSAFVVFALIGTCVGCYKFIESLP